MSPSGSGSDTATSIPHACRTTGTTLSTEGSSRYRRFHLSPAGEVTEDRIGSTTWYDMFEKPV
ncbi:MAG: hypothetical protein JXA64_03410 [Candidatus Fermentibacteraceae bacterium]|nr:hypothetical protein [Candidatus Fermentibacteraceae bacterium]MBN2608140.1 hypothetical protein [Candidatus Fermentibacteraceae bacterium]